MAQKEENICEVVTVKLGIINIWKIEAIINSIFVIIYCLYCK